MENPNLLISHLPANMYRAVYFLIHALFRVLTAITSLVLSLQKYANDLFCTGYSTHKNDQYIIELGKTGLIKVPQHIAIIFNNTEQQVEPLARLVRWIVLTGVQYISFYDFRGMCQRRIIRFTYNTSVSIIFIGDLVEIRPDICKRLEEIKSETQDPTNDKIKFYYLTSGLNTTLIRSACQEICKSEVTPVDISIPLVDKCLRNLLPDYSDPDLAIYFDDHCCTYGMSPWHIRLTEFAQVKLDSSLKLENYLKVLYKYSKCEQRFGK